MAPSSHTILQFMLSIVWTCLNTIPEKKQHPIYTRVFSDYKALEELFSTTSLVFAPGLFEVLNAVTPPSVSFYKTLPTANKGKWAVYLILLEKQGHRSKIYVGSGTDAKHGSPTRLVQYDTGVRRPMYVETALRDGFVITRKGLLCTAPIPSAALVPSMRALFLAIEATLAFGLWAMVSKKSYGFGGDLCTWDRQSLEYDGCCTHCSLAEGVRGDRDRLSAEQLEAQAAEIALRHKDYHKEWRAQTRASDPETYAANAVWHRTIWVEKNPEKVKEIDKRCKSNAVKQKRHYCEVCDHSFTKKAKLTKHLKGPKHAARAAEKKPFHCDVCDKTFTQRSGLNHHLRSPTHAAKVAEHPQAVIATSDLEKKPYHCDLCDRGFSRQSDLSKHFKGLEHTTRVAGKIPFHCTVCNFTAWMNNRFKEHLASVKHVALAAEIGTTDWESFGST